MLLPLYIGPGMGLGGIILIFLIAGLVIFSLGYIVWLKVKKFRKNK